MSRVAIMQPYFVPYAGYFGLIAGTDLFVIYDCVQFPRRGWVHRNRLLDHAREPRWLTLPIAKAQRTTRIADLEFRQDGASGLLRQLGRFPALQAAASSPSALLQALLRVEGRPVDYLQRLLEQVCLALELPFHCTRSSALALDPELAGQERILAIAEAVGARTYVNAAGGRALYEPEAFARRELELRFLPPYTGPSWSILQRLQGEEPAELRRDILSYAQTLEG